MLGINNVEMLRRLLYAAILFVFLAVFAMFLWGARAFTVLTTNDPNVSGDVTILVLGKAGRGSEGGKWNEARDLADAIVLIKYVSAANAVEMISIPRDLYGNFGGETFKVNEAVVRNKIPALMQKVPEITGVPADKFVVIDLGIIKRAVDALGGLDMTLPEAVTDAVSGYTLPAGSHHLSGDDVVWLIRNRFAPEGDFFREKNQHLVIEALVKRFARLTFADRMKLFFVLTPDINSLQTNVSWGTLFPRASNLDELKFVSVVIDFKTGLLNGTTVPYGAGEEYVLIPKAGVDNYKDIRDFITFQLQQLH